MYRLRGEDENCSIFFEYIEESPFKYNTHDITSEKDFPENLLLSQDKKYSPIFRAKPISLATLQDCLYNKKMNLQLLAEIKQKHLICELIALEDKDEQEVIASLSEPTDDVIFTPPTTIAHIVNLSDKFSSLLKDIGSDKFLQSLVLIDLLEKNPELKDLVLNRFNG